MKKVIVGIALLLVAGCSATTPIVKPAPTTSDVVTTEAPTPTITYTAPTSTIVESPAAKVAPTTVDSPVNNDPTTTRPTFAPTVPNGATARCNDGAYSFSKHRSGTCSSHHGVAEWLV